MKKYLSMKRVILATILTFFSLSAAFAVEVTVNFTTSTGDPIVGSQVDFKESGGIFSYLGTTDANGQIIAEVGPISSHAIFNFHFDDRTKQLSQNINTNPIVNFSTVLTTFKVVDTEGNELVGNNARYHSGSWKTFGSGTTTTTQEMLPGGYAFRITWNGMVKDLTYAISSSNNEVVFVIQLVTVRLLNSEGNEIESDNIQYLNNGSWVQFGDGATPETIELLPTSAQIRVFYNGAYQQINQNLSGNPVVTFQTAAVNYQSTGSIKYSFAGGPFINYTGPKEMLKVNYKFRFEKMGYPTRDLTRHISANETKSLAFIYFQTSNNSAGISGATTQYNSNGWLNGAPTDGEGVSFNLIDGLQSNLSFKLSYLGASNSKNQNISTNSYINFNTVAVSMKLLSSTSEEIESENAEFKSDIWRPFGDGITSETVELLTGNYKFKVYYAGAYEEKNKNVTGNTLVQFNTVSVNLRLLASNGDEAASSNAIYSPFTSTTYYTFGTGIANETMELLPQNYKFRLFYGGAMKQINKNVGNDPVVTFNLTQVIVELLDIDGNELASDNITYFITGNGWNQFGDGITTATYDLLWGYYDFRVYYNGHVMQHAQNIANPVVTFVYEVANDLCANAEAIICGSSVNGSTNGATFDDVGFCGTSNTTSGVWYTFEATSGTAILSTCNQADYDTKISVFSGSCVSLACVDGQDDNSGAGCTGFTTELTVNTTPGETYYVLVHGYSNATGNFTLSLDCPLPLNNDDLVQSLIETIDPLAEISERTNDGAGDFDKNGVDEVATSASITNSGNYPNPFSSITIIEYEVLNETDILLTVYDLNGKLLKTLVNKFVSPGTYRVTYDGSDQNGNVLPAGMYIYKLSGQDFMETKRMIIQR